MVVWLTHSKRKPRKLLLQPSRGLRVCTLNCCLFFVAVVLAPHQQTLDKPLEKWTNQELIDWAKEVCDDVVDILMREKYDGLILAV